MDAQTEISAIESLGMALGGQDDNCLLLGTEPAKHEFIPLNDEETKEVEESPQTIISTFMHRLSTEKPIYDKLVEQGAVAPVIG